MSNILMMILIPFIFVLLFTPIVKELAFHINALDIPDERKVHKKPMPRMGGIAIFGGFLLGYILFGGQNVQFNSILIGGFILIIAGMCDDIKPIKPIIKFGAQLLAAIVLVFYGGFVLHDINAFGIYLSFDAFAYILTIFFILGAINSINLIDGLDGLAAGISAIYFLTIGIISAIRGSTGLDYILSFIMLGSTIGFLFYNFNPASIFMGDSGSMFLGYIISVIALLGFKNVTMTSFIIPLFLLAIPILDTLFAIIRRTIKKESISKPDKSHIHHQFLNRNLSQKHTVLIIYAVDILFALTSIFYVLNDRVIGYILYGILMIIVLTFILVTNVIVDVKSIKRRKR